MAWGTGLRFNPLSVLSGRLWVRLLAVTVTPVLITVVSVAFLANYITIGQFETFLVQDTQQRDERLERVVERYYQEQGRNWRRPISLEDANDTRVGTLFVNPLLPGRASSLRIQAFLGEVNRLLIIGCVLAVVAGVALTILFSNRLRAELAILTRVTRQLGRGELELRVPTPEKGDLADLGTSINRMAEDLERQLR